MFESSQGTFSLQSSYYVRLQVGLDFGLTYHIVASDEDRRNLIGRGMIFSHVTLVQRPILAVTVHLIFQQGDLTRILRTHAFDVRFNGLTMRAYSGIEVVHCDFFDRGGSEAQRSRRSCVRDVVRGIGALFITSDHEGRGDCCR